MSKEKLSYRIEDGYLCSSTSCDAQLHGSVLFCKKKKELFKCGVQMVSMFVSLTQLLFSSFWPRFSSFFFFWWKSGWHAPLSHAFASTGELAALRSCPRAVLAISTWNLSGRFRCWTLKIAFLNWPLLYSYSLSPFGLEGLTLASQQRTVKFWKRSGSAHYVYIFVPFKLLWGRK